MSYRDSEYAFVHRFGRHGYEAPEEILKRDLCIARFACGRIAFPALCDVSEPAVGV